MKKLITLLVSFVAVLFVLTSVGYADEPLKFFREQAGDQTFAIKQGYVNNYVLVASTNTAVTVPSGYHYALFNSNCDIWVKLGGAAAIPAADVTDGTGSELNPHMRRVEPGATIGVISESAAKVSIVFYK
jgi:hypothetical protein